MAISFIINKLATLKLNTWFLLKVWRSLLCWKGLCFVERSLFLQKRSLFFGKGLCFPKRCLFTDNLNNSDNSIIFILPSQSYLSCGPPILVFSHHSLTFSLSLSQVFEKFQFYQILSNKPNQVNATNQGKSR